MIEYMHMPMTVFRLDKKIIALTAKAVFVETENGYRS